MFQGRTLQIKPLATSPEGLVELCFDHRAQRVNKFDRATMEDLRQALRWLADREGLRGVLVTSAKDVFIAGGDINEFGSRFAQAEDELLRELWRDNEVFMALEDLDVPSVAAINGAALGGGCELALVCAYRVMADTAQIGVPEVGLGLFPGLGGLVRLPRVAGLQVAVDWVSQGSAHGAEAARAAGVVDAVCPAQALREQALDWLRRAAVGELDWRTCQAAKRVPVPTPAATVEAVLQRAGPEAHARETALHQPAARMALGVMTQGAALSRDAAQWLECEAFAKVTRTQAGVSMVQAFMDEQDNKRRSRQRAEGAPSPLCVALLGRAAEPLPAGRRGLSPATADAADLLLLGAGAEADVRWADGACVAWLDAAPHAPHPRPGVRLNVFGGWARGGLVEVVRLDGTTAHDGAGAQPPAVARAFALALALGKTAVQVHRGPGLVERLLAPCRQALQELRAEGVDDARLAQALQRFGWAPRHLGLPEATAEGGDSPPVDEARLLERLTLPLIIAAARALEDGTADSAADIDLALRLVGGLPAYLGGPLQYADWLGLPRVLEMAGRLGPLGPHYQATAGLQDMARRHDRFHGAPTAHRAQRSHPQDLPA